MGSEEKVDKALFEAVTIPAKYVFLDVVDFSRGRSVEAQSDIVQALNQLVNGALRTVRFGRKT